MPAVSRRGPGFPGYRVGRNYRLGGGVYIGTRPGKASARGICRRSVSERRETPVDGSGGHGGTPDRMLSGWANYWHLGQVSPAHQAIDAHTGRRLRQWLCRKPGSGPGGMHAIRTKGCGKPIACRPLSRRLGAFRGGGNDPSESRMRENRTSGLAGGDGETWPRWGMGHRTGAKAVGQQPLPAPTVGRASPQLYQLSAGRAVSSPNSSAAAGCGETPTQSASLPRMPWAEPGSVFR